MIRVEKTHLPVAALTHPGMKGKNNEDRFAVSAFRMKTQPETSVLFAILSDGIGGNRAGEVASELAVNQISRHVSDSDGRNPPQIMEEAILKASEQIYRQAQQNPEQHGMGATCACIWIAGDHLYTATIGDSRIYLMREGTIRQVSTDHTWIQEALERGVIQPDEVAGHPNSHVIRRYLGSPTQPEVDFRLRLNGENDSDALANQGLQLRPNDRLLECSDGLTDLVSDEEILSAFENGTLEEAGHNLIALANERGGHDNITLVAIQVPEPGGQVVPATARPVRAPSLLIGCLGVVLVAALVGAFAGNWLLNAGRLAPTPTLLVTISATITVTTPTATVTANRTPSITPSPFVPATVTPTPRTPAAGASASLTPWPTNTPALPVVTVAR